MAKYEIVQSLTDKDLIEAIALDDENYKEENAATLERCKAWRNVNSEIWTGLKKDDELIAYVNFMPLKEDAYKEYREGKLQDWDISPQHIAVYKNGGRYKGLFMSIVVKEEHRDGSVVRMLLHGLIQKIKFLKLERDIQIGSILFDCVSDVTLKFCERHGFTKLGGSKSGVLYEGSLTEILNKV